jgi:osmotically-inducible protein OsmY
MPRFTAGILKVHPIERENIMKTDNQIQQDVIAELLWEPSVSAGDIVVAVKDGIVTLAGQVTSYAEKWDAERVAKRVVGVKALAIELDVNLPGSSHRTDVDIARAVDNALQWSIYVPKDAVQAMVERGFVTLSGEVHWEYQREAAANAVRFLMGVTGVSDQIALKPTVTSAVVKKDIEAALKRRAHNEAQDIAVVVNGADVTLSGKVPSWSERNLVRYSAWGTSGVRNVVDHLTVAA